MTRARTLALGAAGAAVGAAYLWHASRHGRWQVDDAGITFAYARNLAEGWGPVTNPGDTVPNEGWSNPVWTFVLALLMLVGAFDLVWTPKVLSVLCTLATFGVLAALVRRVEPGVSGLALVLPAAWLTANGSFVAWSVGGLENAQYVLAITGALLLYLQDLEAPGRWPRSGPVFFLAAISRPEGILYTLAAGGDALLRAARAGSWRWLARLVAGLAVPLVVYVVWHLAVFGDLLPNTYYAKSREASLLSRLLDPRANGWRYLLDGLTRWGQAPLLLLAVVHVIDRRAWVRGLGALGLALVGSVAFVLQANGDWMMQFRFMSPTFALAAVLAAIGVGVIGRAVVGGRAGVAVEAALGVGALGSVGWHLPAELEGMLRKPTVPLEDRLTRLPRLLDVAHGLGVTQPVILMSDMGGPMWVNDARQAVLVDMFGLCDRQVALALHERDVDRLWEYGFSEHDPALMQFPSTLYERWRLDACVPFQDRYMHLDDFRLQGATTGYFLRRDLVEPPWEPGFATGEVVVQRPTRVHRVLRVGGEGRRVELEVLFSLTQPARVVPQVRLLLRGARDHDVVVPLLPALRPDALVPDRVYRHRGVVEVPEEVGEVREARAIGTPEPSTLRPPPAWERIELLTGELGGDWTLGEAGAVRLDGAALVFTPDGAEDRLCVPSVLWAKALRIAGRVRLPEVAGRVDLDLRWFGADGAFKGRSRAWSWAVPFDEPRDFALALDAPAEAHQVRVCLVAVDGPARVELTALRWERRD